MKILHYIPSISDHDLVSDYVRLLVSSMSDLAEVKVSSQSKEAMRLLTDFAPDILHVHACWSYEAFQLVSNAYLTGMAIILSPHGGLDSYPRKNEQQLTKLAKTATYQYQTVRCADALLATSEKEQQEILQLGWKKRIGTVASPLLDSRLSPQELATQMTAFYQKIIDTRYARLMKAEEREAICSLLHAAMAEPSRRTVLASDKILTLRGIKPVQWRRIMLFAEDEDIRGLIDQGITRMQLSVPAIDATAIDRFKPTHPKATGPLPADKLLADGNETPSMPNIDKPLVSLYIQICNARYHLRHHTFSMHHLADLYRTVKFEDYDEVEFEVLIKAQKLKMLTSRLISVMAEMLYLEEGFMPTAPLNDTKAQHIKQALLRIPEP